MPSFRSSRVILPGSTGIASIAIPFQPYALEAFVSPKGSTDGVVRFCNGAADGTLQNCITTFTDGGQLTSRGYNDRIISAWENVGGTLTETFRVNFSAFTATGVNVDVIIPNVNYTVYMRYWG